LLYILNYIAYWLAPWSRVLVEKLTASQLVKKFPHFMEPKNFITAFTSSRHLSLSWAHTSGLIQAWDTSLYFITRYVSFGEDLFAPHPTPKLEYYPLSAVCDCIFNVLTATLHIGSCSSIPNLRTCHAVVTGTHLSWLYCILWWIYYNKWFRRCIVSMYNKHFCVYMYNSFFQLYGIYMHVKTPDYI
jgi:hypothetical protein